MTVGLAAVLSTDSAAAFAAPRSIAEARQGKARGLRRGLVCESLHIRYGAASNSGANRFRAPHAPTQWDGVQEIRGCQISRNSARNPCNLRGHNCRAAPSIRGPIRARKAKPACA